MGGDIVMGAILVAVGVGLWLTRRSKGADRLPGMQAQDDLLGPQQRPFEHGEAFGDEPRTP